MAVIRKKIWPEYFDAVASGRKKAELRLGDFAVQEGDTLVLEEYDPKATAMTGRKIEKRVTHVMRFKPDELPFYTEEEVAEHGLQIISIE